MIILPCTWAESEPVVGGTVLAVNVGIVATTGYRASRLLVADTYNDQGDSKVAVPASMVTSNQQGKTVLPDITTDQLKALPEFLNAK